MIDAYRNCVSQLWELLRPLAPHDRYRAIVEALRFEPGSSLEVSFAIVGPLRAVIAATWECLFQDVVPITKLRALAAGHDTEFRTALWKLAECLSVCECQLLLVSLLNWLRRKSASVAWQRLLVADDVKESAPEKPCSCRSDAPTGSVSSLQTLVAAGHKFRTIYADPPWAYDNRASRGAAANHYGVMTVKEICREPVAQLAADQAHLHLWTTNAFLRPAFEVIKAWGFRYKSCFVWVKEELGMGNYWRVSHEFLLLGVRGQMRFADRTERSWRALRRTMHSRKPAAVRLLIERVSPGPYLELYGREEFPDSSWTVYGNEVERRLF